MTTEPNKTSLTTFNPDENILFPPGKKATIAVFAVCTTIPTLGILAGTTPDTWPLGVFMGLCLSFIMNILRGI